MKPFGDDFAAYVRPILERIFQIRNLLIAAGLTYTHIAQRLKRCSIPLSLFLYYLSSHTHNCTLSLCNSVTHSITQTHTLTLCPMADTITTVCVGVCVRERER